jgi:hypothetical protein
MGGIYEPIGFSQTVKKKGKKKEKNQKRPALYTKPTPCVYAQSTDMPSNQGMHWLA